MKKPSECTHRITSDRRGVLPVGALILDGNTVYRVETKPIRSTVGDYDQYCVVAKRLPDDVKATMDILAIIRKVITDGRPVVGSRCVTLNDSGVARPDGQQIASWTNFNRDSLAQRSRVAAMTGGHVVVTVPNYDDSPSEWLLTDAKLADRLNQLIAGQPRSADLIERSVREIDRTPPPPPEPPFDEPEPTEWLDLVMWATRKSAANRTAHSLQPESDADRAAGATVLSAIATSTSRRDKSLSLDGRTTYPGADFYYGQGWTVIIQDPE